MSWAPPNRKSDILLFSLGFIIIFWTIRAFLGGLIWSKTLENNFSACHVSTQQEVGYSGLFKKHMLWNLKYSSRDFQQTSTKLGERDLKTLAWRGDEVMARIEIQEVSNKVHIHCLILITLQWFVRCMKPIASM